MTKTASVICRRAYLVPADAMFAEIRFHTVHCCRYLEVLVWVVLFACYQLWFCVPKCVCVCVCHLKIAGASDTVPFEPVGYWANADIERHQPMRQASAKVTLCKNNFSIKIKVLFWFLLRLPLLVSFRWRTSRVSTMMSSCSHIDSPCCPHVVQEVCVTRDAACL